MKILPLRSYKPAARISLAFLLFGPGCSAIPAAVVDNTMTSHHWKYYKKKEQLKKQKQELIEVGEIVYEISHVVLGLHALFSHEIRVTRPLLSLENHLPLATRARE